MNKLLYLLCRSLNYFRMAMPRGTRCNSRRKIQIFFSIKTIQIAALSGRYFKIVTMNVSKETELLDYEEAEKTIEKERPRLIMAGASNYSRVWNWGPS